MPLAHLMILFVLVSHSIFKFLIGWSHSKRWFRILIFPLLSSLTVTAVPAMSNGALPKMVPTSFATMVWTAWTFPPRITAFGPLTTQLVPAKTSVLNIPSPVNRTSPFVRILDCWENRSSTLLSSSIIFSRREISCFRTNKILRRVSFLHRFTIKGGFVKHDILHQYRDLILLHAIDELLIFLGFFNDLWEFYFDEGS